MQNPASEIFYNDPLTYYTTELVIYLWTRVIIRRMHHFIYVYDFGLENIII